MRLPWHILSVLFWFGIGCSLPVKADIYEYTSNDGMVYLSNVQKNSQYKVLISVPPEPPTEKEPPAQPDKPPFNHADKSSYNQLIKGIARKYGVDSALLHAVITVESKYNPRAVSNKGAVGLMQLMPKIARQYGIDNLYDPAQNVQGGAQYLRDLLNKFNGDVSLALAAYNAGEIAVARNGNRIPPYRETRDYVPRVLHFYRKYQASQLY
ncbi:membrane-bound lytic murein transglycosylase C precursor [mine drainage metagenome]|uniref:Membrane-bound lytic murein transglycosylase C n=1 Tax=mine drainage metagenome TaxID=410659 RepID=A0A1J5T644_9ZZZZ